MRAALQQLLSSRVKRPASVALAAAGSAAAASPPGVLAARTSTARALRRVSWASICLALVAAAVVGMAAPVCAQPGRRAAPPAPVATPEPAPYRLPLEELLGDPEPVAPALPAGDAAGPDGGLPGLAEPGPVAAPLAAPQGGAAAEPLPATAAPPSLPAPALPGDVPAAAVAPLGVPTSDPTAENRAAENPTAEAGRPVADSDPYLLSPGDVLLVSVWREEQLQRELVVLPDGTISFPLAGRVDVVRKTSEEVEQILANRLKKYIPDAAVSVSVVAAAGYRIYVVGAVNKPGEFQVPRRITVMQALSLAGGLTPFAGEDSIRIIRRENDRTIAIPFAYSDVKRGNKIETDIELKSGDTVVVAGESLF